MKKIHLLFPCILFFCACTPPPPDLSREAVEAIRQADLAMSDLASEKGFFKALIQYADTEMVKLGEGQLPVIGKSAFAEVTSGKDGPTTLSWKPEKVWAAMSGELGYSWGNWKFVMPDTILHGNYFTAWKKQEDRSWKWVIDGGNNTPPPAR